MPAGVRDDLQWGPNTMAVSYKAVLWNRQKRIYDLTFAAGVVVYALVFATLSKVGNPNITAETLVIRATGTAAFLLLHVVLSIGPLARLDRRFLPLLYNRRHLGVTMFVLALLHGAFSIIQFHTLGNVHPLVSLLSSNPRIDSLSQFPFQPLGFAALIILYVMASTSHDFWLANLSAPVWKALHMLVYIAYALLVMHVALGTLQAETHPALAIVLCTGVLWVVGLHVLAGWRERPGDRPLAVDDGLVHVCRTGEIPENEARVACIAGERVAVFRHDGTVSAVSNVCQHQNGPLGEGRIIDGCITCPWHGYQYLPDSGASPPPFTEKIPTFRVVVKDGEVWVDPRPLAPGTRVEPARVDGRA